MKKLLTLLMLVCMACTGAWAQTIVAQMQDFVNTATLKTAVVSTSWETNVENGAVYEFVENNTYIGSATNSDLVDKITSGTKYITFAAWIYGVPTGDWCIFGYGGANDGIKCMISNGRTMKMTTKSKKDFTTVTPSTTEMAADRWNLVAFLMPEQGSSNTSYRYFAGSTTGGYYTRTDYTSSGFGMKVPGDADKKFAVGSGNATSSRERFGGTLANLTVIESDDLLSYEQIYDAVGEAPTACNYVKLSFSNISASSATVNVTDQTGNAVPGVTATFVGAVKKNGSSSASSNLKTASLIPTYGIMSPDYGNAVGEWWEMTYKIDGLAGYKFNNIAANVYAVSAGGGTQTADTKKWKIDYRIGATQAEQTDFLSVPEEELVVGYYNGTTCHHIMAGNSSVVYTSPESFYLTIKMTKTSGGGCHAGISNLILSNTGDPYEGKEFSIKNRLHSWYLYANTTTEYAAGKATADASCAWTFISDGNGKYTLKNGDYYIKQMPGGHNDGAQLTTNEGEADHYEISKNGDGYTLFKVSTADTNNDNHMYMHGVTWQMPGKNGNGGAIVRWGDTAEASMWIVEEYVPSPLYSIVCTGLAGDVEGGVCYNRVNYTDEMYLDESSARDALIAMHVSGYNGTVSVDDANKTITVTYSTDAETTSTLWHGNVATNSNQIMPASRIPAIITANNGDILAFSDWRYNFNDIGRGDMGGHIDIEMRRSTDGGQTWKPAIIAARGTGQGATAGYGDAAVVADRTTGESQQVLLLAAAGSVSYTANNRSNSIRMAKFTSSNNGATWSEATDITSEIFAILPDNVKGFFATSGKITQASFKAAGASHNRIYSVLCTTTDGGSTNTNYVIYSDDFGANWAVLGGTETPAMAGGNEAHVTELPNGDLLLDSRASGRLVNLFTYSDKDAATGTWGASSQKSINVGTACNGDIDVIDGYRSGTADAVKVLIQSAPRASSRSNIRYYYKELPAQTDGHYTLSDFVGGWTEGYQVCAGSSAYSSITSAGTGVEYMLYEKNTTNDTFNYDIEFAKHNISDITNGAYLDHATVPVTINYTLTDMNGQTYTGSCEGVTGTAPNFTGAYGYTLTGEQWGEVVDNAVSYTATINFPFPVSSNNVNKWVNLIYLPNYDRYISYDGTNAKMCQAYTDTSNDPGTSKDQTNFIWSVIPVLEAGTNNFGFKIYSKGANKYVSATSMAHQAQVTLAAEGDVFQLIAPTTSIDARTTHKDDNKGVFVRQIETNTFSICTEGVGRNSLTFWNTATSSHAGQNVAIVEAWDMQEYDELLNMLKNNVGTKLGQYCSSTKTAEEVAEVISSCEIMHDIHAVYYENVANMKEIVSTLALNMPQPGMFLRIKASYNNKKAWSGVADEQEIYLTSGNCEATGYTGRAAFALCDGANTAANTIFYYTDGKLVAFSNGLLPISSSNFWKMGAVGDDGVVVNFEEVGRNIEVGAYRIEFNNGGRSLFCQRAAVSGQTYYFTDAAGGNMSDAHYRYFLEEVEALPLTVGETTFATFYTPVNVAVPSGITPYVCHLDGDNLAMYTCKQKTTIGGREYTVIPAHTAVMIKSNNAQTYSLSVVEDESIEEYTNNSFFGDVATKPFAEDYTYYSLQKDKTLNDGTVGFFIKPSGNFKGFQAFLKTEITAPVQRFNVTFDEDAVITGIADVLGTENINIPAFDLSGRKVDANSHRGLYIMNGKKVIR